ncbi:hypothetical protein ARMGADRAFT_1032708 [Armillaria gallica]|uniref:Uncharacterized protein n=1 Tax=Armillaria gallica TaxID=47427 RepID=A0A2H3DRR6_ARMGA|nr:hypothetical protein ARMGADRAFT_1032708 [Armillaria gallica]
MTPLPQKEKTPVPQKQQSMASVTPQQVASHSATPAANMSSSNVQASDSTCINISKPPMPRFMAPSTIQPMGRTSMILRKVMPFDKPGASFQLHRGLSERLHSKLAQQLKTVPPINAMCSGVSSPTPSQALAVNATHPNIIQGPNPSLLYEGSVLVPSNDHEPLFLLDTDDEEDQVQEDLMETGHVDEEVAGTNGEDSNVAMDANDDEAQGTKSDVMKKKKKKDSKGKDPASGTKAPHKHARTDDDTTQVQDKLAPKKPKLKETIVIDKFLFLAAVATKVVCKRGPRPSKPPPVTLGISGGGFGERVPSLATVVKNGIQSIGVLVIDNDFGDFIEVNKSYWSKAVMLFMGEQVNGVAALNPINHYHPKGSDVVNTFKGALNAIEANNTTISLITQQYLAGLSVVTHTNSIRAQMFQLHECLAPIEEDEDNHDSEDEEYEALDDVAEGVAGSSKKRKHKSG